MDQEREEEEPEATEVGVALKDAMVHGSRLGPGGGFEVFSREDCSVRVSLKIRARLPEFSLPNTKKPRPATTTKTAIILRDEYSGLLRKFMR